MACKLPIFNLSGEGKLSLESTGDCLGRGWGGEEGVRGQGREAPGSTSRWEKVKCRKKSNVFQNWKVAGSLRAGHLDEKGSLS